MQSPKVLNYKPKPQMYIYLKKYSTVGCEEFVKQRMPCTQLKTKKTYKPLTKAFLKTGQESQIWNNKTIRGEIGGNK